MIGAFALGLLASPAGTASRSRGGSPHAAAAAGSRSTAPARTPQPRNPAYARAYAIHILHPKGAQTPPWRWWDWTRIATSFSAFGEPVHAVASGTVVASAQRQRDHRSRNIGLSLAYLFIVEDSSASWADCASSLVITWSSITATGSTRPMHPGRRSLRVAVGDRVHAGDVVARWRTPATRRAASPCATDGPRTPTAAAGVPFRWNGCRSPPTPTTVWTDATDIVEGLPSNGQVSSASPATSPAKLIGADRRP